jgi:hypothetical protein
MPFPGATKIAKRFGITLVCVLAARGCANEIEGYTYRKGAPALETRANPAMTPQQPVPYGTSASTYDARMLERVLLEARYAP